VAYFFSLRLAVITVSTRSTSLIEISAVGPPNPASALFLLHLAANVAPWLAFD